MRFSGKINLLKTFATTVFSLSLFSVWGNAAELTGLLPAHSAMVAGADFAALRQHSIDIIEFSPLLDACGKIAGQLQYLIAAGDHNGRRRMILGKFAPADMVEKLCRSYTRQLVLPENVYYIKGQADDRRNIRMVRLKADTLGIYTSFPPRCTLPEIPASDGCRAAPYLPRRSGLLLWGVGVPESKKEFLKDLCYFEFALEKDFSQNLRLHGRLICRDSLSALAAELFFRHAVPLLLLQKYQINTDESIAAVKAMQLKRNGRHLNFSTRDIQPVIRVVARILHDEISSFREAVK